MIRIGMKDDTPGASALELVDKRGAPSPPQMSTGLRPERMPVLPDGHSLIGSLNQGFGELLYLCETLADAQQVWDWQDYALAAPVWYHAPVVFINGTPALPS